MYIDIYETSYPPTCSRLTDGNLNAALQFES